MEDTTVVVEQNEPIDMAALEIATNHEAGLEPPASAQAPEVEPVVEAETPPETPVVAKEGESEKFSDEELALIKEWRSLGEIAGTPFKSVDELKNGYKRIQGEYTKVREKTKPFEAVIDRMARDPQYANLVQQAQALLDNPQMLQAYQNPAAPGDPKPNPKMYETWTDEGLQAWNADHDAWLARQVDARINARLGTMEQASRLENFKREFKAKFPDADDPETLRQWSQTAMSTMNPIEAAYKLKNWDNALGQMEAKVRKELTADLKKAQETRTPTGSPAAQEKASLTEILKFIGDNGGDAAKKRFGEAAFLKALQQSA